MDQPIESRFRITICHPIKNKLEYHTSFSWLLKKLNQKYGGVTFSETRPLPIFRGWYYSQGLSKVIRDRIVFIFSDAEIDPEQDKEVEELEKYLQGIKKELHKRLPAEEEIWIVYHPITRIVKPKKSEITK